MAASILIDLQRDMDAGRVRDAARRLIAAAAQADPAALAELAHWRIGGDILKRDLPAARALLARASGAGDRASALLHAYFLAAGVGGAGDWPAAIGALRTLAADDPGSAAQLRLIEAMDLNDEGGPKARPRAEPLSERPYAIVCRQLLSAAECDHLRDVGAPSLQPTLVIDPASGRQIPHPVRRSEGMTFGVYAEDLVVNAINRRIAAFSGTTFEQGEPLQLLRYRPGDEYRAHLDGIANEPNQRILTVLIYLSDDYAGGETSFVRTGLDFKGRKGDALLFRNVDDVDRPDPLSLHAGLPVTGGVKLIASRWIRRSRFVYPPPVPLLPDL